MANYHVLEISDSRDTATVAFHIAVPNENNAANVNLQAALKQYLDGIVPAERVITQVPWLEANDPTEYTQIDNGEVYEYVQDVEYDANSNNTDKLAVLNARLMTLQSSIPDTLRERLKFWGYEA